MTRTRVLSAAAVLVALALAGCSGGSEPTAAPSSAAAPTSAAASPSAAGPDGYAARACKRTTDALDAGGDGLDELAAAAYEAQQSTEQTIVRAGTLLAEQVKLAEAAQGASDEAVMEANLAASALQFTGTCAAAGL